MDKATISDPARFAFVLSCRQSRFKKQIIQIPDEDGTHLALFNLAAILVGILFE